MKSSKALWIVLLSVMLLCASCGGVSEQEVWLFPVEQEGQWGYINAEGEMIIAPQFNYAFPFSEGLAAVMLDEGYGFVDARGKLVIPAKFQYADRFSEGLAFIKNSVGKVGFIDRSGHLQFVISGAHLTADGAQFSQGLAPIYRNGLCGYIDSKGQFAIEPLYSLCASFTEEGLAAVTDTDYKSYFINQEGQKAFTKDFELVSSFSEGLAVFVEKDKYGYLNPQGEVMIPAQFEDAVPFSEGLASISQNGKYGFIDQKGQLVIEPQYSFTGSFSEGLAVVSSSFPDEKEQLKEALPIGYIDRSGQLVIPAEFDFYPGDFISSYAFEKGVALVPKEGRFGYIDKQGKYIWRQAKKPETTPKEGAETE